MNVNSSKLTKLLSARDNQKCHIDTPLPMKSCNYAIIGRKGCGKTSLMSNIIMKEGSPWYKFFNLIFLISPTASKDPKMDCLVDDLLEQGQFFNELNDIVLQDIKDKIELYLEKKKKKKKKESNFLVIYDDCIHMIKDSKLINEFAIGARHMKVTNIYLLQKWSRFLPPLIRSNLDLISFFRTENVKELESFIDEIGYNKEILEKLYDFATCEAYSFLHINMYSLPIRFYKQFDQIEFKKNR